MKKNNRPLSPHLTIYKPQITSIMSISHRVSGVFQSFGTVVIFISILMLLKHVNIFLISVDFLKVHCKSIV